MPDSPPNASSSQYRLLLPKAPLIIKDSGWQRRKSESRASEASFDTPDSLESISITTLELPHETGKKSSRRNSVPPGDNGERYQQKFAFVDSSTPSQHRQQDVQKLVKSHARKWAYRDQHRRNKSMSRTNVSNHQAVSKTQNVVTPAISNHEMSRNGRRSSPDTAIIDPALLLLGLKEASNQVNQSFSNNSLTPAPTAHISSTSQSLELARRYQTYMSYWMSMSHIQYPLEDKMLYNPLVEEWLPLAMQDEAVMLSLCYSAAVFMEHDPDWNQPANAPSLMSDLTALIIPQLERREPVTDATISAVAQVAGVDRYWGDYPRWSLHMRGIVDIVYLKGGLLTVEPRVQIQACRSDIGGAVDLLAVPFLPLPARTQPSLAANLSSTRYHAGKRVFAEKVDEIPLNEALRHVYLDLWCFNKALGLALDQQSKSIHPAAFDEDTVYLQHTLLKIPIPSDGLSSLHRAFQISALLYLRSVVAGLPFSSVNTKHLVQMLMQALLSIRKTKGGRVCSLTLWLNAMGALASHGSLEHDWFLQEIARAMMSQDKQPTWICVKHELQQLLWLDAIHDVHFKQYWEDFEDFHRELRVDRRMLSFSPSSEEDQDDSDISKGR